MRSIAFTLLFILIIPSAKSQSASDFDIKKLETMIENARLQWNIPGLAVGVVYKNQFLLQKGFGTCTQDKNEPVNDKTQFGIASNTKAFTALSIAILAEEGKLKYDDKVINHLPWFASYNDYVSREMTIRDLLTHRSGLGTFSGDLIWYGSNHSREEIVKRSKHLKPVFGFREKFGYSNIHYLAAGLIIEKASGLTYDAFLKKYIFDPLGMKNTNSSISNNPNSNVAQPHAQRDGKNIPIPYVNWDNIAPAGSINSNVEDMTKWINCLLMRTRYKDQMLVGESHYYKLLEPVTPIPLSRNSAKLHPAKHLSAYGMGFNLFDYHGNLVINHSGGLDGMISHVAFVPEKDFGFVILCNAGSGLPGILMYDLLDFFMQKETQNYCSVYHKNIEFNQKQENEQYKLKWADAKIGLKPPLDVKLYAGTFKGNVYGSATVSLVGDQLEFKLDHSPAFHAKLHYWKEDMFYFDFEEVPSLPRGTITFKTDAKKKKITQMVIDCPNPDFDFTELDFYKK